MKATQAKKTKQKTMKSSSLKPSIPLKLQQMPQSHRTRKEKKHRWEKRERKKEKRKIKFYTRSRNSGT
jgi:hypothetical protein